MPQLDQLTFFSQFFWLCFFYLGFYLILVKYFLPKISRILKVRQMKMNSGNSGQSDFVVLKEENQQIKKQRDEALSQAFRESKHFLNESYQKTSFWVQKVLQDINAKKLQKMNTTYIHSIQNLSFVQTLTLHNLKTVAAPSKISESTKMSKETFFNTLLIRSFTRGNGFQAQALLKKGNANQVTSKQTRNK